MHKEINIIIGKNSKGFDIEMGLKDKIKEIKNKGLLVNSSKNYGIMINIVSFANSSVHELKARLKKRKASENYIKRFIDLLNEENIFSNLNN